jgi:hypothetical protein
MTVPETPVDENHPSPTPGTKVWPPWKITALSAKADAEMPYRAAHDHLDRRVPLTHAPHSV